MDGFKSATYTHAALTDDPFVVNLMHYSRDSKRTFYQKLIGPLRKSGVHLSSPLDQVFTVVDIQARKNVLIYFSHTRHFSNR